MALVALALGSTAALGSAVDAATADAMPSPIPAARFTADDTCQREPTSAAPAGYGWPLKPFHRQHPVRGYFGDPRIGHGRDGTVSRSFHFGVDVSAPDGTAVYATASGIAHAKKRSVSIRLGSGASFAYWHIVPSISDGQQVVAYRTIIGHVARGWGHVHFAEWRAGGYLNPLRPGAMGPYADRTCPSTTRVSFERSGEALEPEALRGSFDVVVEAVDAPAMSAPAPWYQLPVTPALVRWRVANQQGRVITPWQAAYDVRERLPSIDDYHLVFAAGTTQNHPDRPGLYRFQLARSLNAGSLGAGRYKLQVALVDSRGNRTYSSWPFAIA